jgi:hypothetical protein
MITQDLSKLVAVAAGTRTQVRRWEELLRKAAIEYHVAESAEPAESNGKSHAELWVALQDAEKARTALKRSVKKGDSAIW